MAEKRNSHREMGEKFYYNMEPRVLYRMAMRDGAHVVLKRVDGNPEIPKVVSYASFDKYYVYSPPPKVKHKVWLILFKDGSADTVEYVYKPTLDDYHTAVEIREIEWEV